MIFERARRIHFVGIGGAGMSAIAKVLAERGLDVSGSDLKRSTAVNVLEAMGARIAIGHDASLVEGADVVVISSAIPRSNVELRRAEELGIVVLGRGEALASVLEGLKSVVVAGTHGKTTTTSMIVSVWHRAGRDVTYLVGGGLNDAGTNAKAGRDEFAVAESDESDGSFLLLTPHIAVVTNVELDHVDHWGSLEELEAAFAAFVASAGPEGAVVLPAGERKLAEAAREAGASVLTFGDGGDVAAADVELGIEAVRFRMDCAGAAVDVHLAIPGLHNVANALAAAGAAIAAGLSPVDIASGLSAYRGVERRFQVRGTTAGVTIIDDYAHHPTEVSATIAAARTGSWQRLVVVFQPHRYSRTAALASAFGEAFAGADRVVVTDVYGAGEEAVPGVTGKLIADAVSDAFPGRTVAYFPHRSELLQYLIASVRPGDALLTLGAGDITSVGEELSSMLADAA